MLFLLRGKYWHWTDIISHASYLKSLVVDQQRVRPALVVNALIAFSMTLLVG